MTVTEAIVALALGYTVLGIALVAGVVWALERMAVRREKHVVDILDRFLSRSFGEFNQTRALLEQAAAQEVQQQESEDLDDPETIARLVREAEETFAKTGRVGENGE